MYSEVLFHCTLGPSESAALGLPLWAYWPISHEILTPKYYSTARWVPQRGTQVSLIQAHANTVRAGQDKRTRLPMMPRVPIKPPDGVPTDEQYYGNMEGVITMRFKGERLAKIAA